MNRQKGLSPILIIVLVALVIGGYLIYQKQFKPIPVSQPSPSPTIQPLPTKEPEKYNNGSIKLCGDVPDAAFPEYGRFEMRTGPQWSPDCKHVVWAMWQSGTGCPDCPEAVLSDKEGVFLYNIANKKIISIYKPQKVNETPEFIGWIDNDNFLFKINQKEYKFNLITNKILDRNSAGSTTNWKTFKQDFYSFKYPSDWYFVSDEGGGYITDQDNKIHLRLTGWPKIIDKTIKEVLHTYLEEHTSYGQQNLQYIKEKEVDIEGNKGWHAHIKNGALNKEDIIVFIEDKNFPDRYSGLWMTNYSDSYEQVFDQILSTFKFTN